MTLHTNEEAYLADTDEESILITYREIGLDDRTQRVINTINRYYTGLLGEICFYNVCYIQKKNDFSRHVIALHETPSHCKDSELSGEILEILYDPKTNRLFAKNGRQYADLEEINTTIGNKNVELIQIIMCYVEQAFVKKDEPLLFLDLLKDVNFSDIYDFRQLEWY